MIIVEDIEQGTEEWYEARLGVITASRFADVLTQPSSKKDREAGVLSGTAKTYLNQLVAEKITGERADFSNEATDHGNEWEPAARESYEFITGRKVREVGIVYLDEDRSVASSPDGLQDPIGGVEIKCPIKHHRHMAAALNGVPDEHMPQIQGCMWICQRQWWDFISYNPEFPGGLNLIITRVMRDEEYIRNIIRAVTNFKLRLDEAYEKALQLQG